MRKQQERNSSLPEIHMQKRKTPQGCGALLPASTLADEAFREGSILLKRVFAVGSFPLDTGRKYNVPYIR